MKVRIVDTHKSLPIRMRCLTEGKPYKHIIDGGLAILEEGEVFTGKEAEIIKYKWDNCGLTMKIREGHESKQR